MTDLDELLRNSPTISTEQVERIYNSVVAVLKQCSDQCIPKRVKNFYKFWWNQELNELKQSAVSSAKIWKNAGKPKNGPLYLNYRQDKLIYKRAVKEEQKQEKCVFTNDLHEALLMKSTTEFWKCWNSKFPPKLPHILQVDGLTDEVEMAKHFADYFEDVCSPFNEARNTNLVDKFLAAMSNYNGIGLRESHMFDVGLLSTLVLEMKNGKAAGLDSLTAEHIKNSHPVIFTILCKLFN